MAKTDPYLQRVRGICLALPDTKETLTWGQPHFRVGEKIFAGCGEEGGKRSLGFKLERPHAEAVLDDPRFRRAPYVGHHGWVTIDPATVTDWDEMRDFLHESYRLIAPKATLRKLEAGASPAPAPKRKAAAPKRKTAAPKKKAAKRTTARR